jgi:hypothetical protein
MDLAVLKLRALSKKCRKQNGDHLKRPGVTF